MDGRRQGRQIYIDTFSNVGTYWEVNDFQITDMISEGETVAAFGQFTYTSVEVGHRFTSPLAIKATVKKWPDYLLPVHGGHLRFCTLFPQERQLGNSEQRSYLSGRLSV